MVGGEDIKNVPVDRLRAFTALVPQVTVALIACRVMSNADRANCCFCHVLFDSNEKCPTCDV